VEPPKTPDEGYHLTEDLIDRAIGYISDHKSVGPAKPYLLYLALGAGHAPHQAPEEYLRRYRGSYDEGWDVIRERRHASSSRAASFRGHRAGPRNEGVLPWAELPHRSARSRRGCRRRSPRCWSTPTPSSPASSRIWSVSGPARTR